MHDEHTSVDPDDTGDNDEPAANPADGTPDEGTASTKSTGLIVVGVGASAGGLKALKQLVASLKETDRACFVVAQHVAPTHDSKMVDLISPHTALRCLFLEDRTVPEPNTVYVVPPMYDAELTVGGFRLFRENTRRQPRPSINRLFASLAASRGDRCVGVVLSGTGSDGAEGVTAIRLAGGFNIAQQPESAEYGDMPEAAIATECVDRVVPPPQIGEIIDGLAQEHGEWVAPLDAAPQSDSFGRLTKLVRSAFRLDLRSYKRATILRRLDRRMEQAGLITLDEYVDRLEKDPAEMRDLINDFLIPVTSFFRDPEVFDSLASRIDKGVDAALADDRPYRAWVAGTATGQEAYTIAMVLAEAYRARAVEPNFLVFASDVNPDIIDIARRGRYTTDHLKGLPDALRDRYFEQTGSEWDAGKMLRKRMIFAAQNLITDPPFSKLDLITCRNVLIYLDGQAQKHVLSVFHYALRSEGLLLLGRSESVDSVRQLFSAVEKRARLYRRTDHPAQLPVSIRTRDILESPHRPQPRAGEPPGRRPRDLSDMITAAVTERFTPPAVVLDESDQVIHFSGDLAPVMRLPKGPVNLGVFDLVHERLSAEVRALVFRSRRERTRTAGSTQVLDGAEHGVMPAAELITVAGRELVLLSFEPSQAVHQTLEPAEGESGIVAALEEELANTRLHLQTVVEELESSNEELQSLNEELQSSNEELQSTNEELQTSNEELQSTNEELITVNDEVGSKTAALEQSSNDLRNIKESLLFPLLVVDDGLRLTQFNAAAERLLHPSELKINQQLRVAHWRIEVPELARTVQRVFETKQAEEREWDTPDGQSWLLRAMPYRADGDHIAGCVLAFDDVSDSRRAQRKATEREALYRVTFGLGGTGMLIADSDGQITDTNPALQRMLGARADANTLRGRSWLDLVHPDDRDSIRGTLDDLFAGRRSHLNGELRLVRPGGEPVWVKLTVAIAHHTSDARDATLVAQLVDIDLMKRRQSRLTSEFTRLKLLNSASRRVVTADNFVDALTGMAGDTTLVYDDVRLVYVAFGDSLVTAKVWRDLSTEAAAPGPWRGKTADAFIAASYQVSANDAVAENALPWASLQRIDPADSTLDGIVWVDNRPVGALSLQAADHRQWGTFDKDLVSGLTDLIAVAYRDAAARDDREQAVSQLAREKDSIQVTLASIGDGVITTDLEGMVEYINPAAADLIRVDAASGAGRSLFNVYKVVRAEDGTPLPNPVEECLRRDAVIEQTDQDAWLLRADGSRLPVDHSAAPIRDTDGQTSGAVLVFRDVSDQRMLAKELSYRASHDPLTDLLNRSEFERRLQRLLASARKSQARHVLCLLDLDRFKAVNDTAGHAAGDELLKAISNVMREQLRRSDQLARLGGDEFGILLEDCEMDRAKQIAEQILDAVASYRFEWREQVFSIGVSIGLAAVNADVTSIEAALQAADGACYAAKQAGRHRLVIADPNTNTPVGQTAHGGLVGLLREAVNAGSFRLYGQPVMHLPSASAGEAERTLLVGAEPRVQLENNRWSPASAFRDVAERHFFAGSIDRWTLSASIGWLKAAKDDWASDQSRVGFWLSGQSLGDAALRDRIRRELDDADIDPARLVVHITEAGALNYMRETLLFVGKLKATGCKFALDDCGTNALPLAFLRDLPLDYLRLDADLVRSMQRDTVDTAVIESLVKLARELNVTTIANGVDRKELFDAVASLGVQWGSGSAVRRARALQGT